MTRFNPKHNKKRFDLYSFYSLLAKCKITELLDHRGKTPFDSELINRLNELGYNVSEREARIIGKVDAILIDDESIITLGADQRGDDNAVSY